MFIFDVFIYSCVCPLFFVSLSISSSEISKVMHFFSSFFSKIVCGWEMNSLNRKVVFKTFDIKCLLHAKEDRLIN